MIEFSGELSEINRQRIIKNDTFVNMVTIMNAVVIYTAIILAFAIAFHEWLITIMLSPLLVLIIYTPLFPHICKKKDLDEMMQKSIIFDEEYDGIYVDYNGKPRTAYFSFHDVKKIIDLGDSYYIKFYFPKLIIFVCQKDLITQGTIEEFEEMFADKIIVKEK